MENMLVQTISTTSQLGSRGQPAYKPKSLHPDPLEKHFLAQELNNEACEVIDRKNDILRAIQIFGKALELSKWTNDGDDEPQQSDNKHCRLDASLFVEDEDETGPIAPSRSNGYSRQDIWTFEDQESERYLYRQLLRVNHICIKERYYMGFDLTVIILFNLAIAHQLLATSTPRSSTSSIEAIKIFLERALKLYELCTYALYSCRCSEAASLRLKMLVMNNLGEIHRMSDSPKKHRKCLDYLLKGLMFIVEGEHDWFTPTEVDGIYRNIQASRNGELGRRLHAGAA